jgi:hypothetical protein
MALGALAGGAVGGLVGGFFGGLINRRRDDRRINDLNNNVNALSNRVDSQYASLNNNFNSGFNSIQQKLNGLGLYNQPVYAPANYGYQQAPVYAPAIYNQPVYQSPGYFAPQPYGQVPIYGGSSYVPIQQNGFFGPNQQVFISNGDQNFTANQFGGYNLATQQPQQLASGSQLSNYGVPQQVFIANGNQNFYGNQQGSGYPVQCEASYHPLNLNPEYYSAPIPWPPAPYASSPNLVNIGLQVYS